MNSNEYLENYRKEILLHIVNDSQELGDSSLSACSELQVQHPEHENTQLILECQWKMYTEEFGSKEINPSKGLPHAGSQERE